MLHGYLCMVGVHSVQSCCTISISAFTVSLFVTDIAKSKLVCVWLSDLYLSRHLPLLGGAVPTIQWVCMTGWPKTVNRVPINGGGSFDTICTVVCQSRCDISTIYRRVDWGQHHFLFMLLLHFLKNVFPRT